MYIPLGGSRYGLTRQLLATSATFIYIFVWHGCRTYVAVWTLINFAGIIAEIFARKFKVTQLPPNTQRRGGGGGGGGGGAAVILFMNNK